MPSATVQLHLGDCLEFMRTLPAGSVDAVITDPPYGIDYQSARRIDKAQWKPKIANDKAPFVAWIAEAHRIIRAGGALVCFCRWDVEKAFSDELVAHGFDVRSQVVWDKCSHGMGDLNASFAPQHENALFATKGAFKFWAHRPKSVIRCLRVAPDQLAHPNEKPVGVLSKLCEAIVKPGDTIFDPFMGSGTTGVAAVKLGRNFIGCEIEPKYYEIAQRRIADAQAQMPLPLEMAVA